MLVRIISPEPKAGKTTLALNMATKLCEMDYRVLLIINNNHDLLDWVNKLTIQPDSLTIKTLPLDCDYSELTEPKDQNNYDFILLDTNSNIDFSSHDYIDLICLDFSSIDASTLGKINKLAPNEYIVPCKVRFNDGQNLELLSILANQVGVDKVLDGIPRCERIHDLPLIGKTIWELDNQPLQAAFLSIANSLITYK